MNLLQDCRGVKVEENGCGEVFVTVGEVTIRITPDPYEEGMIITNNSGGFLVPTELNGCSAFHAIKRKYG